MTLRPWLLASALFTLAVAAAAREPEQVDRYWTLIHDQAILEDLKLTPAQRAAWRKALDPLDVSFFPFRGRTAAEATAALNERCVTARAAIAKILTPAQRERLDKLQVRLEGTEALLRDEVAAKIKLLGEQRAEIGKLIADTRAAQVKVNGDVVAARLDDAAARKELERLNKAEWDGVLKIVTREQQSRWSGLVAGDFDPAKMGQTRFKAPELIGGSQAWLSSPPLESSQLRGRVVVVHYFAFGCINCIHNYPSYRKWQDELAGKDVVLIGIHTPETQGEHNVETLKSKLKAEGLQFPVIVDNEKANWLAWGNTMWPSVYVLDQEGYLRSFWAGELKWQGRDGEAVIRKQIDTLLSPQ
jgi:thiol-disulfide isomerase/thioredoxin